MADLEAWRPLLNVTEPVEGVWRWKCRIKSCGLDFSVWPAEAAVAVARAHLADEHDLHPEEAIDHG